jgi:hypothetical protein
MHTRRSKFITGDVALIPFPSQPFPAAKSPKKEPKKGCYNTPSNYNAADDRPSAAHLPTNCYY